MAKRNFKVAQTWHKAKKNPLVLGLVLLLAITIFLIYIIFGQSKQGMFGSSIEFTRILLLLPFLPLIISWVFKENKDRLIFLYTSLIPVYVLLGRELFHTNFDSFIVNLSLGYVLFPIIVNFGINIIKKFSNGSKNKRSRAG